eukprot:730646-Amphidinium_carterae.1
MQGYKLQTPGPQTRGAGQRIVLNFTGFVARCARKYTDAMRQKPVEVSLCGLKRVMANVTLKCAICLISH